MKRIGKFLGAGILWMSFAIAAMFTGAQALQIVNTAFPSADKSTNWGINYALENLNTIIQTNMLSKVVVNNNAASSVQLANNTAWTLFTGTNVGTLTVNLPAAANASDGEQVAFYTQAAIATSSVFASTGATVVGGPATMAAGTTAKFLYDSGTTTWYKVD